MTTALSNDTHKYYIGLMSGTSLDSIDAALVQFNNGQCQLIDFIEHEIPQNLRLQLIQLCSAGNNEIERLGVADKLLAKEFSKAVQQLLQKSLSSKEAIIAIGSHGQTIRHRPDLSEPFTLQIGDPNTIAFETGITTVADFRRKDIAAGGQGAPLAPAFHQMFFSSNTCNRAVINIGGMSNISLLNNNKLVLGYDIGPGNILMDAWMQQHRQKKYDKDGCWAATGKVIPALLDSMLAEHYFSQAAPKSTGRELFNLEWIETKTANKNYQLEHVQATLLELTAQTIHNDLNKLHTETEVTEVYICGGGAYNNALMARLKNLIAPRELLSTQALGIAPEWIEACAFAWMAHQTLNHQPSNQPIATGASKAVVLGAIYY
jgi:anhydro-N-acetylmuramic acid kinase